MERRNLDFGIPLSRDQWRQVAEAADFQADNGVLEWTPGEFDVIHVSVRADDAPSGWGADVLPDARVGRGEREVARFIYNDGRPMAQLDPPVQPAPPAVLPQDDRKMQVELERWVRGKWHVLLEAAGLHDNIGAIPDREPDAVD